MKSHNIDPAGHKSWANKLIWIDLHEDKKPLAYALKIAHEVMGSDYVPHKPISNNDGIVDF